MGSSWKQGNPSCLSNLKVLIADDHELARQILLLIVEQNGGTVATAKDAQEAYALFEEKKFDILLSDIGMPGETGMDLMKKIRGRPSDKGGNVPAIAITAWTREDQRAEILSSGFDSCLPKPIHVPTLLETMVTLLEKHQ